MRMTNFDVDGLRNSDDKQESYQQIFEKRSVAMKMYATGGSNI